MHRKKQRMTLAIKREHMSSVRGGGQNQDGQKLCGRRRNKNEAEAKRAGTDLQFHKVWEHHDAGTRVERIDGRTLAEMLTGPPTSDPSQLGTVIEVGYLNGKQTVIVKFDDGTFSAPSAYADQFRKLN